MSRWTRHLWWGGAFLWLSACAADPDPEVDAGDLEVGVDAGDEPDGAGDDTGPDVGEPDTGEPDPYADLPPRPWDSLSAGPLNVAYRFEEFTYEPRGDDEPRTLPVSIWYPTLESADGAVAFYSDGFRRNGVVPGGAPAFAGPAPVMLFSHGHQSINWQSYYWTEFLASHGWIVIAPDHIYGTLLDLPEENNLKSGLYRAQDLLASLDYLQGLGPEDPLTEGVSEMVAASGHSFGGQTVLVLGGAPIDVEKVLAGCESGEVTGRICLLINPETALVFAEGFFDERVRAVIPKTAPGAEIYGEGIGEVSTPVYFWTGGKDATLTNEDEGDPIWEALGGGPHRRVDVADAGHFSFSNMCDFMGGLDWFQDDGCGEEFFDPDELHRLVNGYSLNFLRLHLELEATDDYFDPGAAPLAPGFEFFFKE